MINPRGLIVLLFAVAILLTVCIRARADDRPQLDCATVRAYVAQHGIVVAYARALADHGRRHCISMGEVMGGHVAR